MEKLFCIRCFITTWARWQLEFNARLKYKAQLEQELTEIQASIDDINIELDTITTKVEENIKGEF